MRIRAGCNPCICGMGNGEPPPPECGNRALNNQRSINNGPVVCEKHPTQINLNGLLGYWITQTSALHLYHDGTSMHLLATGLGTEKGFLIDIQGFCQDTVTGRTFLADQRGYWEYKVFPDTLMIANSRALSPEGPVPNATTYRRGKIVLQ